jgi:hypothetical protein
MPFGHIQIRPKTASLISTKYQAYSARGGLHFLFGQSDGQNVCARLRACYITVSLE